jgi:hypothetical protein
MSLRAMSESERKFLEEILEAAPGSGRRWWQGAANALILFAVLMLVFAVAWRIVGWLARATADLDIGWNSPAAPWILFLGGVTCAAYAIVSSVRWVRRWTDTRPLIRADLAGGQVMDETYSFTAAKRFQEPEHGGLIYFLRTRDDKVFVLYDSESQDLGVQDEDPLKSTFRPCTNLVMVRAPKTGYVISKQFSGESLSLSEPRELTLGPEKWPEQETCCEIPWEKLEARLSKRSKRS